MKSNNTDYIETGKIVGTHGIKGEIRVEPWCDNPDFLTGFKFLYTNGGENEIKIESSRVHGNIVLIKAKGVDSINDANILRGKILYVKRSDIVLDEDRYFVCDLIGCCVFDADSNNVLGVLTDVSRTGANDVWHIECGGKTYLLPAVDDVIINVDIANKKIVLRPIRGIFDDED